MLRLEKEMELAENVMKWKSRSKNIYIFVHVAKNKSLKAKTVSQKA